MSLAELLDSFTSLEAPTQVAIGLVCVIVGLAIVVRR